ncbi:Rieske 2Fe-2S domain-containing protein [Variovorax paradoxus]|uniref:Rieske 2Fe-2S domain-containing protein n=1 Tax=Variovorax paradoxus TaxID=34073 RepID=UPI002480013D|nr:Rieske 2Fe-2S domain-containing protein [Variovorax paradoxus]WGT64883.1 Rieske 2Fe-2S domain-containing protein [Variovorax paradoxus]
MMSADSISAWHPVARSADVRPGANIVAGFARGQELALWRSADGAPQAWENRCPHRSVRFTLGQVAENRLSCAYHGWQYAAGSGQCMSIPAHPGMPPPSNLCAKVFSAVDAAGMLWVNLAGEAAQAPPQDDVVPAGWSFCRTLAVRADAASVRDALARRGFASDTATTAAWHGPLGHYGTVALVLDAQPRLAFIHLWTDAAPGTAAMKTLHITARGLRSEIEEEESRRPQSAA